MSQNIADLAERFAIDGHCRVIAAEGGLPAIAVRNELAEALVYLHGAHVARYAPLGGTELLWLSAASRYRDGQPIRGGIPLCWPWFSGNAPREGLPAHGFLRQRSWRLTRSSAAADGATELVFSCADDEQSRAMWPHPFRCELQVSVGAGSVKTLWVHNTGDAPFTWTGALHSYLAVDHVRECSVHGLEGARYRDNLGEGHKRQDGPVLFRGETDRCYLRTDAEVLLADPRGGRAIRIGKHGSQSTVVWNPWTDKARRMQDFGDDEWPSMCCIETANVFDDAVTQEPGSVHRMELRISEEPLSVTR